MSINKFPRLDEIGELIYEGCDIDGNLMPGTRTYPTYTCGHCCNIIVMRPDRSRDRVRCLSCSRLICEKSDICNNHCTPIHEMAKDMFQGAGEFGKYVPAIMSGVSDRDEATKMGLVTLS